MQIDDEAINFSEDEHDAHVLQHRPPHELLGVVAKGAAGVDAQQQRVGNAEGGERVGDEAGVAGRVRHRNQVGRLHAALAGDEAGEGVAAEGHAARVLLLRESLKGDQRRGRGPFWRRRGAKMPLLCRFALRQLVELALHFRRGGREEAGQRALSAVEVAADGHVAELGGGANNEVDSVSVLLRLRFSFCAASSGGRGGRAAGEEEDLGPRGAGRRGREVGIVPNGLNERHRGVVGVAVVSNDLNVAPPVAVPIVGLLLMGSGLLLSSSARGFGDNLDGGCSVVAAVLSDFVTERVVIIVIHLLSSLLLLLLLLLIYVWRKKKIFSLLNLFLKNSLLCRSVECFNFALLCALPDSRLFRLLFLSNPLGDRFLLRVLLSYHTSFIIFVDQ